MGEGPSLRARWLRLNRLRRGALANPHLPSWLAASAGSLVVPP